MKNPCFLAGVFLLLPGTVRHVAVVWLRPTLACHIWRPAEQARQASCCGVVRLGPGATRRIALRLAPDDFSSLRRSNKS